MIIGRSSTGLNPMSGHGAIIRWSSFFNGHLRGPEQRSADRLRMIYPQVPRYIQRVLRKFVPQFIIGFESMQNKISFKEPDLSFSESNEQLYNFSLRAPPFIPGDRTLISAVRQQIIGRCPLKSAGGRPMICRLPADFKEAAEFKGHGPTPARRLADARRICTLLAAH